jgi:hypothetical protein
MKPNKGQFPEVKVQHTQARRLYHGSDAEIPVGDTVEARGSYVNGEYLTEPEHRKAFATVSPQEAKGWGKNVYRVVYHEDESPREVPDADIPRLTSKKGFRVVGKEKI